MNQSRSTITQALILFFLIGASLRACRMQVEAAKPVGESVVDIAPAAPQVALYTAQTTTSWDGRLAKPEPFELPLLYLNRQRRATAAAEHTLTVRLSGLEGKVPVEVELVSLHENPTTGQHHRQSLRSVLPDRGCTVIEPCKIAWPLDATTMLSDFYRLVLRDGEGTLLWENPDPERPDLVALDAWQIDIDDYVVQITYSVLFPFARGRQHLDERLAPEAVHDFIANQFLPTVIETWHTQFGEWGFGPIHPAWDADKIVELFFTCPPFALFDGAGTYTVSTYSNGSPYPQRRIWLLSNAQILARYDSLANGFKVVLAHEFFHLVQWNVRLSTGCLAPKWTNVIIEAQATFVSSAQYPELELSGQHLASTTSQYSATTRRFLERRLKTSYAVLENEETDVYDLALYWRFLYEQAGWNMSIVRAALEEMTCRPVDDVPTTFNEVMDAALVRAGGPFHSFEQSIVAFAQANYALRLENGRCLVADRVACQGRHYDPHGMYTTPMREAGLTHREAMTTYDGIISASFGTDLIDVYLPRSLAGTPLTIAFRSAGARFNVQAWKLYSDGEARDPSRGKTGVWALTPQPEMLSGDCGTECHLLIPQLDLGKYDRLALIVVRLDPGEKTGHDGAYRLIVDSLQ